MHNFEELKIWQKAMQVVEEIYVLTTKLPKEEGYGYVGKCGAVQYQLSQILLKVPDEIQMENSEIFWE